MSQQHRNDRDGGAKERDARPGRAFLAVAAAAVAALLAGSASGEGRRPQGKAVSVKPVRGILRQTPKQGVRKNAEKAAVPASSCEEVLALGETDTAPLDLLRRSQAEGLAKSDPECLAMTSLRYLNLGHCEAASHAAKRARELAPSDPVAVLAGGMVTSCELGRAAAERTSGAPIACDDALIQGIVYDVGRAALLSPSTSGVVPLVVRSLEADIVPRCRDDGQMKALFGALEMASPGVKSRTLRVLEKDPHVPWNLSGAAALVRLERLLTTGDPGPGGHEMSRSSARALLDAWPDPPDAPRAQSLYAQAAARAELKSAVALASKPEGFGLFLDDLDSLERQGMLDALPVIEVAAEMPVWAVDASLGNRVETRLQALAKRLAPLEARPEGALLLFKLRSVAALKADAAPCEVSEALGTALVSFARHGAARMPLAAYREVARHVAIRAREAARRCPTGMTRIAELSRIIEQLEANAPPWNPSVFIEGGGQ